MEKTVKLLSELSNEKQLSNIHIQKIRDETGARIIFPGPNNVDKESIMITGTKEAAAAAKKELEARIVDLDNTVMVTMIVDPKHHRYFVGRRGEVLRKIGEEFGGVVVNFSRKGVVSLKGTKNCIEGAVAKIEKIVQDLSEQVTLDCKIEQQLHRTVKGSKVQKITGEFNVQIKFPVKNGANPNIVRITGKKGNCEAASQALLELVPITVEVSVPHKFRR